MVESALFSSVAVPPGIEPTRFLFSVRICVLGEVGLLGWSSLFISFGAGVFSLRAVAELALVRLGCLRCGRPRHSSKDSLDAVWSGSSCNPFRRMSRAVLFSVVLWKSRVIFTVILPNQFWYFGGASAFGR